MRPSKFFVVVSIAAPNENVGRPGDVSIDYVFDYGGDVDVALFPNWLQGITRKSVEKSQSGPLTMQLFPYLGPC